MPAMNEKTQLPSILEPAHDTTVTTPEKASLSNASTLCPLPAARLSAEATPRSSHSANPFDTDIEAMVSNSSLGKCSRKSDSSNRKDCPVWPGKQHWADKAKDAKLKRSCTMMARLTPRQRIIAKILLVFLVVGVAVGVGFGVSKPLGASIWGKKDE